jgi:hypothetical protein
VISSLPEVQLDWDVDARCLNLQVVDTLLASTTLQSTVATNGTTNGTSTSRTGGTLLGAASNVQVGVYGMTLTALVAVVGMF